MAFGRILALCAAAISAVASPAVAQVADAAAVAAAAPSLKAVVKQVPDFADEFTTGLAAGAWERGYSPWRNTIGNRLLPGTGETAVYVDDAYLGTETMGTAAKYNTGGTIIMQAQRMDAGTKNRILKRIEIEKPADFYVKALKKADWKSAMIKGTFSRSYGYWEANIRWVPTAESWPAFWLLPQKWAGAPEIDIVEMKIENGIPKAVMGIHSTDPASPNKGCRIPIPNNGLGFHQYGFRQQKGEKTVTFYIDRKLVCTMKTPADLGQAFYPIVNLAMGGWGAAPTAKTVSNHVLQTDYVRHYPDLPPVDAK